MLSFLISDVYKISQNYHGINKVKKYNHSAKEVRASINKNWLKIYNNYRMKEIKLDPVVYVDFKNEKYKWNKDYSRFILVSEDEETSDKEKENEKDNNQKDNNIFNYQLAALTLFIGIGLYTFNKSF